MLRPYVVFRVFNVVYILCLPAAWPVGDQQEAGSVADHMDVKEATSRLKLLALILYSSFFISNRLCPALYFPRCAAG